MARNSEKAMAVLNRWTQLKTTIVRGVRGRRPRDIGEVESLQDCEHWRSQAVREITRRIAEIQNAALGEHRIRDLNDEINKLLREKARWEDRVKDLGGADYKAAAPRVLDAYGAPLAGDGSYKYFGAAKDLPGVRELFERDAQESAAPKKTRAQLQRNIRPEYYGWRDEEDGELLLAEQAKENEIQKQKVEEWQKQNFKSQQNTLSLENSLEKIIMRGRDIAAIAHSINFVTGDDDSPSRPIESNGDTNTTGNNEDTTGNTDTTIGESTEQSDQKFFSALAEEEIARLLSEKKETLQKTEDKSEEAVD